MNTKVQKCDSDREYWNIIREAAYCLAHGGLVVFPTETVYGLGANAGDPQALERLRQVKQRRDEKPFTVHVGSRSAVSRFVPDLHGIGRRLSEKAWPGPLTLIFNVREPAKAAVFQEISETSSQALYHDGTIGIRCPDDRVAADLLTEARIPVVAASANPAGQPAPVDAEEAFELLNGQVDLLIDAGRTRYAQASTIVRVDGDDYEILREGVLDAPTIKRMMGLNFLLVCSGNTCRSPMAEGLLRKMLAERQRCREDELTIKGYHIASAGTCASAGLPASAAAVRVMKSRGIDISNHESQPLTLEQINRSDYIFVMAGMHLEAVRAMAGDTRDRLRRIGAEDITDPIGGSDEDYQECAERIEQALAQQLKEVTL